MATPRTTIYKHMQELRALTDATREQNARIDDLRKLIAAEVMEYAESMDYAGVRAVYKSGYTSNVAKRYTDIVKALEDYPELLDACTTTRETRASVAITA